MHIILVSSRLATARSFNVTSRQLLALVTGLIVLAFVTSFLFAWVGIRFNMPFATELVVAVQERQNRKTQEYLRDNISSMAVKLGEMQAQVIRLDSLGERITELSGVPPPKNETYETKGKVGQGGPLILSSQPLSAHELQHEIDRLAQIVEQRSATLTALESQLAERRIKAAFIPTLVPIDAVHVGSPFGHRIDPIAGVGALHEGIDFVAEPGTRVIASAGGVVLAAEYHPEYGNQIQIDHGNDFTSRYAHLSKINVKVGQIVEGGQPIGASGNTGRSTGPHLHFEVRFKGVAQNPERFLQQGSSLALNSLVKSIKGSPPVKSIAPSRPARVYATFNAPRQE